MTFTTARPATVAQRADTAPEPDEQYNPLGTPEQEDERRSVTDHTPPHDTAAERAVIGGMLLSRDAISDVTDTMRPEDHYRPAHEAIHAAIVEVFGRGEPVDVITVTDELNRTDMLRRVGGEAYLHDCVQSCPTAANSGYYADQIADLAIQRRLVEAGHKIAQIGMSRGGSTDDKVNAAQSEVFGITRSTSAEDYVPMAQILDDTIEEIEAAGARDASEILGVPTGFTDLDALLHGLQGGQLVIIAARPAMGKSTLALDIARAAAFGYEQATCVFSLEMSRTEIGMRCISAEAQIDLSALRSGHLRENDWRKISGVMGRLQNGALFVDDSPGLTIPQIRTKARRLKQSNDLKLVIIDYLQLMTSGKKVESRQQEVSEFSRALKLLAKELDVPVVALSQLNRGPEQRTDKRPMLSDLRESGSIEQDADIVILLSRPDAHVQEHPRAGEADLIVAKHRNGPTRDIALAFQGHYSRFANMAKDF